MVGTIFSVVVDPLFGNAGNVFTLRQQIMASFLFDLHNFSLFLLDFVSAPNAGGSFLKRASTLYIPLPILAYRPSQRPRR